MSIKDYIIIGLIILLLLASGIALYLGWVASIDPCEEEGTTITYDTTITHNQVLFDTVIIPKYEIVYINDTLYYQHRDTILKDSVEVRYNTISLGPMKQIDFEVDYTCPVVVKTVTTQYVKRERADIRMGMSYRWMPDDYEVSVGADVSVGKLSAGYQYGIKHSTHEIGIKYKIKSW